MVVLLLREGLGYVALGYGMWYTVKFGRWGLIVYPFEGAGRFGGMETSDCLSKQDNVHYGLKDVQRLREWHKKYATKAGIWSRSVS